MIGIDHLLTKAWLINLDFKRQAFVLTAVEEVDRVFLSILLLFITKSMVIFYYDLRIT